MLITMKVVVGFIGLILGVVLGLRWMFAPESIGAELGITLGDIAALSTARADLGGMFLGAGTLCALGLRSGEGRWLQAAAVLIGAVAVGRALSLVVDGSAPQMLVFLIVEVVMVGALLAAAGRLART
jgi:hypothetical protein